MGRAEEQFSASVGGIPCSLSPRAAQLEVGGPDPLGFGWPSLCTRVAQTWGSVPCSTQEPLPTMMAALVAAALGQRLNTNREWQAFAHTLMLGEHTTNVNSLRRLRFFAIGDTVENESGWPAPRCPRATLCSGSGPDPQDRLKHREQDVPRRGTTVGCFRPGFSDANYSCHHHWVGDG